MCKQVCSCGSQKEINEARKIYEKKEEVDVSELKVKEGKLKIKKLYPSINEWRAIALIQKREEIKVLIKRTEYAITGLNDCLVDLRDILKEEGERR